MENVSVLALLRAMSTRLDDAAAITRAAVTCAESGAEQQAVRISLKMDALLYEAETLHRAVTLVARSGDDRR